MRKHLKVCTKHNIKSIIDNHFKVIHIFTFNIIF